MNVLVDIFGVWVHVDTVQLAHTLFWTESLTTNQEVIVEETSYVFISHAIFFFLRFLFIYLSLQASDKSLTVNTSCGLIISLDLILMKAITHFTASQLKHLCCEHKIQKETKSKNQLVSTEQVIFRSKFYQNSFTSY